MSPLITKAESLIKEHELIRTINNLDVQSAYGCIHNVSIRITILYRSNSVVFTNLFTNQQIIKSVI